MFMLAVSLMLLLHHRSGDLEIDAGTLQLNDSLHHRSGDLENVALLWFVVFILHHRSGDLESYPHRY